MRTTEVDPERIRRSWQGRISGCQLGKPVEVLSMMRGREALSNYLQRAQAQPLRDYVPLIENTVVAEISPLSCRDQITRSEPDDDINYSVLALIMLEERGLELSTADVGRHWLRLLPAGATYTAERAAYAMLLDRAQEHFVFGAEPGFDLSECSNNEFSDWIGAQIRADVYGWVCPGNPALAADLARRDASLSHRGDGVHGAALVAALGAAIPAADSLDEALDVAMNEVPKASAAGEAIRLGRHLVGHPNAIEKLHERYANLSPVHTVNNLALVIWSLFSAPDDYSAAIGEAVSAGWDTDCNGATVGGLWGLQNREIPSHWTEPWQGRIAVTLAGISELTLDDLVDRTVAVARKISSSLP